MDTVFTEEQVKNLNEYQKSPFFHPFTCANGCGPLIATKGGWVCSKCDYTQDWAHKFMLNGKWKNDRHP